MSVPSSPWLVADLGGTHARFALSEGGARPVAGQVLEAAAFATPGEAIAAYLDATGARPAAACLAVAGPVGGDTFRFTNNPWTLSCEALRRAFGWHTLLLENDFAALAWALPALTADDLRPLGPARPAAADAPCAVLGPGTGLGVALLARGPAGWWPLPGEGGHAGFAPQDALEIALLEVLAGSHARVCNENLLSGAGLTALYAALCEVEGAAPAAPAPARITATALDGSDARAVRVLDLFCAILGAVAGDVALVGGARGGVYVGGGIAPRIADFLAASRFRARFEAKGLQRDYVAAIPTWLITAPAPALAGAALALRARIG